MKLISRNKSNEKIQNPWKLLKMLNNQQRITFVAAFLGWTLDAFDYFIVSLTIPKIAEDFKMEKSDIVASVTITLCFRPVGAIIFGLLADRYGRRYPLMLDIILYSAMELASGFAPNFSVFIVLRAIFGVAMGGEWGLGAALAMESLPSESRGLFSGILQQGYATGYLLAALLSFAVVDKLGWRSMFWIGSFPAVLIILLRFFVPESPVWTAQHEAKEEVKEEDVKDKEPLTKIWLLNTKLVLKHHWKRFIYCVLLMACFNFLSHGTQDLYPTFLETELGYSTDQTAIVLIIANLGAIIGGTICGFVSQLYGRKITIIVSVFFAACFIPLYILPKSIRLLTTGAFAVFFFVQGAWGVVPAHLNELSPPEFRGTFPGLSYQLGNLISSSAAQIEAKLGEKFKNNGKPNYGLVTVVLSLIVMFCLIILTFLGKENKDVDFIEQAEHITTNNEMNKGKELVEVNKEKKEAKYEEKKEEEFEEKKEEVVYVETKEEVQYEEKKEEKQNEEKKEEVVYVETKEVQYEEKKEDEQQSEEKKEEVVYVETKEEVQYEEKKEEKQNEERKEEVV